jgi:hypothetical protein
MFSYIHESLVGKLNIRLFGQQNYALSHQYQLVEHNVRAYMLATYATCFYIFQVNSLTSVTLFPIIMLAILKRHTINPAARFISFSQNLLIVS